MDDPSSNDAPLPEPANLRFLRRLVTVLTATMILGMLTVVTLLVLRFNQSAPQPLSLPDSVALPEGARAIAVTQGPNWFAILTDQNEILIYAPDGTVTQRVRIEDTAPSE